MKCNKDFVNYHKGALLLEALLATTVLLSGMAFTLFITRFVIESLDREIARIHAGREVIESTDRLSALLAPHLIARIAATTTSFGDREIDILSTEGEVSSDTCASFIGGVQGFTEIASTTISGLPTSIDVYRGRIAIGSNTANALDSDVLIYKQESKNLNLVSSLHTGPGIDDLMWHESGEYIFAANTSINGQLQIISAPISGNSTLIYSQIIENGTSTRGIGSTIFANDEYVAIGLTKAETPELSVFTFNSPNTLSFIGSYEADTKVNQIEMIDDELLLALPAAPNFRKISLESFDEVAEFSPSGDTVQDGSSIAFLDEVFLGRTVGGFNSVHNHELFLISKDLEGPLKSVDIGFTIDELIYRKPFIYIGSANQNAELEIRDAETLEQIVTLNLPYGRMADMDCETNILYIAFQNGVIALFKTNE